MRENTERGKGMNSHDSMGEAKKGEANFSQKLVEVSNPGGCCEFSKNSSFDEALQKNICDEAM